MVDHLPPCDALVIFGVTGDLARTKLFDALYDLARVDRLDFEVIGVARSDWDSEQLRRAATEAIRAGRDELDERALQRVSDALRYVQGDYGEDATYQVLATELSGRVPLFYLAVPPSLFTTVVSHLASLQERLPNRGARLLVEKPFGEDRASAAELDAELQQHFPEEAIFRIDHFLGKEEVQNLLLLRFANRFLEPLWNRDHIQAVTISMREAGGVESRGSFYDATGATRDVIQNHLLQLLAILAMEPPASQGHDDHRKAKEAVLAATSSASREHTRFGQFDGYRDTAGVATDSTTETWVDTSLSIDTDRWRGVPWRIVAGKGLDETRTDITIELRPVAAPLFVADSCQPGPNRLGITLKPYEQIKLEAQVRAPGLRVDTGPAELTTERDYRGASSATPSAAAYAQLFDAARRGDHEPFAAIGTVLESWRIVDQVLADPPPLESYRFGSAGPGTSPVP